MENPHQEQQNAIMSRIIGNVEKLNEAVIELNKSLQTINMNNMNVELVSQMWANYSRNAGFYLETAARREDSDRA
ncbi:DASH complex subunit dad4 [Savitreella phatthalungensis]